MNLCYRTYLLIIVLMLFSRLGFGIEQSNDEVGNEHWKNQGIEVGLGFYSHFRDYQPGNFYESKFEMELEIGKFLNESVQLGIRLHQLVMSDNSESTIAGGIYSRTVISSFIRHNIPPGYFIEGGMGFGYGFNSFRNKNSDLLRDWENLLLYNYQFATGYSIRLIKIPNVILRPAVYFRQDFYRTPWYSEMPKNGNEIDIGFNFSIILLLKPSKI